MAGRVVNGREANYAAHGTPRVEVGRSEVGLMPPWPQLRCRMAGRLLTLGTRACCSGSAFRVPAVPPKTKGEGL